MKRRQLIQTSLFAGTWAMLSPLARAIGANEDIRVAVIGFNSRGMGHIEDILKTKGCRLVALCDCDETVLAKGKENLAKRGITVNTFTDYRKLCESKEIDAVSIATPNHTHVLISLTAAAHGKHVYVEKPVSHNVWEGRQLALGAAKFKVIIQHGFQRRSETSWHEAFAWLNEGHIGKIKLARGFCYKPRPSIGKAKAAFEIPASLHADLWFGPRPVVPVMRSKFHYDWHWQSPYGNGDLGNQGPHQLDVCRWAIGDPHLPETVITAGGRVGYEDDGDTANTQILWLEHKGKVPILFEVRGLPKSGMDYKTGMDAFKGVGLGNIIEYDGGYLSGGHGANCAVFDANGKKLRSFSGSVRHHQNWIDAIKANRIAPGLAAESAHCSSALAHLGAISLALGKSENAKAWAASHKNADLTDAVDRMMSHLEANKVDLKKTPLAMGAQLSVDPVKEVIIGDLASAANPLLKGTYRKDFALPEV
jgi:predicted dehydrogenase